MTSLKHREISELTLAVVTDSRPTAAHVVETDIKNGDVVVQNTFLKDSEAVLDYEFDWSAWLASGETITSHTITVAGGVTLDSSTASTTAVVAWISGGTTPSRSTVACRITTSESRTDERTITLVVKDR